jgi:hypothetical protein
MRVDKIGSTSLPKREYNAKREWLLLMEVVDGLGGFMIIRKYLRKSAA